MATIKRMLYLNCVVNAVVKLTEQMEILAVKNALTELNQLIPELKSELKKSLKALAKARIELSKGEAP